MDAYEQQMRETAYTQKYIVEHSEHRANKCALFTLRLNMLKQTSTKKRLPAKSHILLYGERVEKRTLSASNGNEKSDHHHTYTQSTMKTMLCYTIKL